MPRSVLFLSFVVAAAATAVAQEEIASVDFILRPTEVEAGDTLEVFPGDENPAAGTPQPTSPPLAGPTGEEPIGAPLSGPTGTEPIGAPLIGPVSVPLTPPEQAPRPSRIETELEPFAATGIRLGTFVIRPAIELGTVFSDNPGGGSRKESAAGFLVAPEINLRSEDTDHEIVADLRGTGVFYDKEEFDDREFDARVAARYDLNSRTSLNAAAGYSYGLDSFSDPETPDAAVERPAVERLDAELGATQRFGALSVGASGAVRRSIHEEVALAGGGTASREELDNTVYETRLRTSYEASGALTPYAEVEVGRREFDLQRDASGFERTSVWGELRGGLIFDLGSKLDGEAVVGLRHEDLEDDRLEDLNVATAAAAVLWSPRRLTDVRVELSTDVRPTSIPGASGSIVYSGTLSVLRRVSERLALEAGAGIDHERFVGIDLREDTYSGFGGFSYAFNRTASLEGRYVFELTDSTDPEGDERANTVTMRVRLQR